MNVNDLPSAGDIPNAVALRRELAKTLNYIQLTAKASPGTAKARVASLRALMYSADRYLGSYLGEAPTKPPVKRRGKAGG